MSAEQNLVVVSRFIEEVINQALVDALDTVMAPTYIEHACLSDGKIVACEDLKQLIRHFRFAFPDWYETVEYLIAQDDLVFTGVFCHGTNTGTYAGIPSTGKSVTLVCIDVFRIAQDKIVEHWGFDREGMMQQLSAMPVVA